MENCVGKVCLDLSRYEDLLNALANYIELERSLLFNCVPKKVQIKLADKA